MSTNVCRMLISTFGFHIHENDDPAKGVMDEVRVDSAARLGRSISVTIVAGLKVFVDFD